jgi:hypothetical protein
LTNEKPKHLRGRPTKFTDEIADQVCVGLIEGQTLRKICTPKEMPDKATILRWLAVHDTFATKYARAREIQAEAHHEELIEIADAPYETSEEVQQAKLRVATRQWIMSKIAPKKYGDKIQQEHSGGVTLRHEDALAQLR